MEPKRKLKKDLEKGGIAHAYLFCGPSGSGKSKAAQWLAKKIVSKKAQDKNKTLKFDVLKIIPDEMGKIGIDHIRNLREFLSLTPTYGNWKGVIVREAEVMTTEAANALLKTLEEPQDKRFLILTSRNPRLLPPTIISRCVQIKFSSSEAKERPLKNELSKEVVQGSLNARFQVAEKLSKKEEDEVKEFLNNLVLYLRQTNLVSNVQLVKKANQTRKLLEQTNVKPRLALEHLLIEADRRG